MQVKVCSGMFLVSLLILCGAKSQSNAPIRKNKSSMGKEKIISKVFYNFVYLKFKSFPNNLYKEVFELDLSKTASMFRSYSGILRDSARERASDAQQNQIPLDQETINLLSANVSNDQYYTSVKPNRVIQIQHLATSTYLISDTAGAIQWKILDSLKTIQGYLCQKALGESHGRNYIVWFCNDLPFNFGPRRLNGLPGLILEAYDDHREIIYTLRHIEKISQGGVLELPADGINATYKEYNKVLAVFEKDPAAFWNQSLGTGSKIHFVNGKSTASSDHPEKENSKPIENSIDLR